MDRALVFGTRCQGFESLRACHQNGGCNCIRRYSSPLSPQPSQQNPLSITKLPLDNRTFVLYSAIRHEFSEIISQNIADVIPSIPIGILGITLNRPPDRLKGDCINTDSAGANRPTGSPHNADTWNNTKVARAKTGERSVEGLTMAYKRRTLEMEADKIQAVLARHNVSGRVRGGIVMPRFVRFELMTELGTRVNKVAALAEEIAMALDKREARVYRNGGEINVEASPQTVAGTPAEALPALPPPPPVTAVLGVEGNGTPLLLRITARRSPMCWWSAPPDQARPRSRWRC